MKPTTNNPPRPKAAKAVRARTAELEDELRQCYDLFERCVKEQHHFASMMLGLVSVRQKNIRHALEARSPDTEAAMVEQGARALWHSGNPSASWFTHGKPFQDGYRVRARAVLASAGLVEAKP